MARLLKHNSWSPDSHRDEAWQRRKGLHRSRRTSRLSRSVTDEDLDELRACIDLGFGFGDEVGVGDDGQRRRLFETFPALEMYDAVNRSYNDCVAGVESPAGSGSPNSLFSPGDSPEVMKARLKQWAQVVACSVRQRR